MEKILEKSGNFVSLEKWEPWLSDSAKRAQDPFWSLYNNVKQ